MVFQKRHFLKSMQKCKVFYEFMVLFKLCSSPGRIFTRRDIMNDAWGIYAESNERTVDVHIKRLRQRFQASKSFRFRDVRDRVPFRIQPQPRIHHLHERIRRHDFDPAEEHRRNREPLARGGDARRARAFHETWALFYKSLL